jgi:methyltransferase (TIGR00027 family)
MEKNTSGIWNGFPCRKRYIDDKMVETLKTKIESVVILGAGLDTLAYRIPQLSTHRVYEVDLPENIHYKKKKLETIYGMVPSNVSLVLIDFEVQNLENVLKQAGHSFDQRSFFVWEGVTQYLTEAAMRGTFQFLAKAKPGSRLVLT